MSFKSTFAIPSDTRYLSMLRQWVDALTSVLGRERFPKKAKIACTLSLVEAVNNAIFHAHARDPKKHVGISFTVDGSKIHIDVSDSGRGIGRIKRSAPDAMISHGRGLFLIHRLMHEVKSRKNSGRHHLSMTYDMNLKEI